MAESIPNPNNPFNLEINYGNVLEHMRFDGAYMPPGARIVGLAIGTLAATAWLPEAPGVFNFVGDAMQFSRYDNSGHLEPATLATVDQVRGLQDQITSLAGVFVLRGKVSGGPSQSAPFDMSTLSHRNNGDSYKVNNGGKGWFTAGSGHPVVEYNDNDVIYWLDGEIDYIDGSASSISTDDELLAVDGNDVIGYKIKTSTAFTALINGIRASVTDLGTSLGNAVDTAKTDLRTYIDQQIAGLRLSINSGRKGMTVSTGDGNIATFPHALAADYVEVSYVIRENSTKKWGSASALKMQEILDPNGKVIAHEMKFAGPCEVKAVFTAVRDI